MKKKTLFLGLCLVPALAYGQIMMSFTGGFDISVGPGTAGYSFTVSGPDATIQSLGVYDFTKGSGLDSSHEIGLWDASSHALLVSTTVPAGTAGTDIANFWYVPIPPTVLHTGMSYVLGARYSENDVDMARGATAATFASGFTKGNALVSAGTGFEFPGVVLSGFNDGFYGPNASTTAVPEPEHAVLAVAFLLVAFGVVRRWKLRSVPLQ